jgi:hypothetical protein
MSKQSLDLKVKRGSGFGCQTLRRRWRHKATGEELTRDFTFLAEGTKFTAELADFLKQRGR